MTSLSSVLVLATALSGAGLSELAMAAEFVASSTYEIRAAGADQQSGTQGGATGPGTIHRIDIADSFAQGALSSEVQLKGWSAASYGHLKAYAEGSMALSAQGAQQSDYVNGAFTSEMRDSFIIRCASCAPGTIGSLSFSVVDTALTARDGHLGQPVADNMLSMANTHWSTSVGLRAEGVPTPIPSPPDSPGPPNPGSVTMTHYRLDMLVNGESREEEVTRFFPTIASDLAIQFVFGEPIHLAMSLTGTVIGAVSTGDYSGSFNGDASMRTDASQSFYWDGITSVRNADGQLITAFTALNDVGIDYAASLAVPVVPEPGTWVLMMGGLVTLGAIARRRRAAEESGSASRLG